MNSPSHQLYIFLFMLYGGIVLGAFFEILKAVRLVFKSAFTAVLTDVVFILAAFSLFALLCYAASYAALRFYMFLGFALGFFIYILGISKALNGLLGLIKKLFVKIKR